MIDEDKVMPGSVIKVRAERPCFAPNTTFKDDCLVVDENGNAWWVLPSAQIIRPAND